MCITIFWNLYSFSRLFQLLILLCQIHILYGLTLKWNIQASNSLKVATFQWCGIFHYHCWTASIKPRLRFSPCRLCFPRIFTLFPQIKLTDNSWCLVLCGGFKMSSRFTFLCSYICLDLGDHVLHVVHFKKIEYR